MLAMNRSGVRKTVYNDDNNILFTQDGYIGVSIIVSSAVVSQTENGRKIVKAGTPLNGDLTARNTAFIAAKDDSTPEEPTGDGKPAVGILYHDVDITDGNANGTLMIAGCVNMERLDGTTSALITASRKSEMPNIFWLK